MKYLLSIVLIISFMFAFSTAQDWPKTVPAAGQSIRVSGTQSAPTQSGDLWKSGNLATESPLPVGYNAPTPQGAIEIKTYPTVRRAELDSSKLLLKGLFGSSRGFWILFNHIKSRKIAMTAPVEFNFRNEDASRTFFGEFSVEWIMSFLYRKPELGATGTDGDVLVIDKPEVTVVSVGLEGSFSFKLLNEGVDLLRNALDAQTTWVAAGEPRFFAYNSPYTSYKWAEVQIPVKLA
jgi:hypothetical protein